MKRLAIREFALLCSPLAFVALVGWLLSKRPAPGKEPLRLKFGVAKPTTLEAFGGSNAVLLVELQGTNAQAMSLGASDAFLELQTTRGKQRSFVTRGTSGLWSEVWQGNINGRRFPINSKPIPAGKLVFGFDALVNAQSSASGAHNSRLSGRWAVNRADLQPLALDKMPRAPLVVLRFIQMTKIVFGPKKMVAVVFGECVFDLTGAAMNTRTPFEMSMSGGAYSANGSRGSISWGTGFASGKTPETAHRRVREWSLFVPTPGAKTIGRVSGRVSAGERWPLAFSPAPFDMAHAKVGQKLKFRAWPVALPKP